MNMVRATISRIFAVAALMMAFNASIAAQEYVAPPVEVSDQKVKKDGKVFYSHVVLERQTLYSISKAYNVTQDEIFEANPGLKEVGLKKNAIIMIPMPAEVKEEVTAKPEEPTKKEAADKEEKKNAVASVQKIHTVRWYETLKDIAAKYNVSESAIIAANNLNDGKIKNRQKLIIPTEEYATELAPEQQEVEVAQTEEEENMDLETAFDEKTDEDSSAFIAKDNIRTTVLLPLKATGSSSSKSNMDFYSGVLLAARELGESGINIDMNVYDISNGSFGATKNELESSDIIIGPVAAADITRLYAVAPEIKALISPLDPKAEQLIDRYCTMVHAPAPRMAQYEDIAQWLREDLMPGDRVIVISEKEVRKGDEGRILRAAIDSAHIAYTPFSYSILEGRNVTDPLTRLMTENGTNRVLIASESEAFVNDAVRNLNLIVHNKFSVVLYGPAKIRTFETIEVENFHNTALHASLTYNIDYDNEAVQDFVMKYRAMFGTEPTQFAFQGYDIARYFFDVISQHHSTWTSHMTEDAADMLQNRFMFKENDRGSYVNSGIRRIIYDRDYSIIPVQ